MFDFPISLIKPNQLSNLYNIYIQVERYATDINVTQCEHPLGARNIHLFSEVFVS